MKYAVQLTKIIVVEVEASSEEMAIELAGIHDEFEGEWWRAEPQGQVIGSKE